MWWKEDFDLRSLCSRYLEFFWAEIRTQVEAPTLMEYISCCQKAFNLSRAKSESSGFSIRRNHNVAYQPIDSFRFAMVCCEDDCSCAWKNLYELERGENFVPYGIPAILNAQERRRRTAFMSRLARHLGEPARQHAIRSYQRFDVGARRIPFLLYQRVVPSN